MMGRPSLLPIIPKYSLRFALVLLLGITASLQARPASDGQQAGVTLAFSCAPAPGGQLTVSTVPVVTPRTAQAAPDEFLAARLRQAFSDQPSDWRSRPEFQVPGAFKNWLRATLKNAGMPTSMVVDTKTGPDSFWNVSAIIPALPYTGVCVDTPTTALPLGAPAIIVPATSLPVPAVPPPLWPNTFARLQPSPNSSAVLTAPAPDAIALLTHLTLEVAAASAAAYARSQDELTYHREIEAFAVKTVADRLGPPYAVAVSFDSPASASCQRILNVTLKNLDPIVSASVSVSQIDLPQNLGGRMTVDAFDTRFGASRLGRRIRTDQQNCTAEARRLLASLLPPRLFPRFLSDAERAAITKKLSTLTGVELVTYHETDGALVFDLLYTPPQGALTLSLDGDTTRAFSGSLNFNYHWQNGPTMSAQGTLGLTSASVSASTTTATHALASGWSFKADTEAAYQRDQDVRLGTRSGPLVTLMDSDAGGHLSLSYDSGVLPGEAQRTHILHAETSLYAHERWLQGNGSTVFLGQPDTLAGPALTLRQQLTWENLPASDTGSRPVFWGKRISTASVEITHWLPSDYAAYSSGRLGASVHQEFGGVTPADAYLELRGAGAVADQAAPRIDFFRLGGDGGMFGLDDGELAGRSVVNGAVEAGYSLGAFLRHRSGPSSATDAAPSKLDALYVFALAEYGRVDRQDSAGADFNPARSATSYALGGRFGGIVPGLGSAASISFGYAWSPESIRHAGRFFTSIVIPFGN